MLQKWAVAKMTARLILFIVFLFLGSRKFLFHRIHTACDSIFESIRYAFDDECITRNADLDFGSFAFLDILKGNLCLLRHLERRATFFSTKPTSFSSASNLRALILISIFTSVFSSWMSIRINLFQAFY